MKENHLEKNSAAPDEMPEISDLSEAIRYQDFKEAKKQTTIRLKASTVFYFQELSSRTGLPYQTLINMYLDDCAKNRREINVSWG